MANTPLRPPNNGSPGRPPKGPRRVPTRRDDLRTRLNAAATFLREKDATDLAQAVESVTAPQGWTALRDTDTAADSGTSPNFPLLMSKEDKAKVMAAAEEAGDKLTHVVNEGWSKYLEGTFTPHSSTKARRHSGVEKETLTVRPSRTLRQQVEATGTKASKVGIDYLLFKYKVGHYAPGNVEETPDRPRGSDRRPKVPRAVREAIRSAAWASGELVTDVVEEGLQKYLAGEFRPVAPPWSSETADMVGLRINPNDDLFKEADAFGELRGMQVATAYLLKKYGISTK